MKRGTQLIDVKQVVSVHLTDLESALCLSAFSTATYTQWCFSISPLCFLCFTQRQAGFFFSITFIFIEVFLWFLPFVVCTGCVMQTG